MSNTVEKELRERLNKWRLTKKAAFWLLVANLVWVVVQVVALLAGKEVGIGDLVSPFCAVAICAWLLLQAKRRIICIESGL